MTVYFAVEIGRRLTEAKSLVPHGEWLNWLKTETEYSQPTASRLMKVFDEYGADQIGIFGAESKYSTLNNLEISKALLLAEVPDEERESFAEEHKIEELSVKQMEALMKERDEAIARAEEAEQTVNDFSVENVQLTDDLANAEAKIRELESRPVDVAVQEPNPELVKAQVDAAVAANMAEAGKKHKEELDKLKKKLDAAEKAKAKAEDAKKKAEDAAKKAADEKSAEAGEEAEKQKAEVERLTAEAAELRKRLALSDEAVATFRVHFASFQTAHAGMMEAMDRTEGETREKLRAAIAKLMEGWGDTE